jgi:subtilase family serine protease
VRSRTRSLLACLATLAALAAGLAANPLPAHARAAAPAAVKSKDVSVCKHAHGARNHCFAIRVDHTAHGKIKREADPEGYGPSALQRAYDLPSSSRGSGETVAVVDANDDPDAEHDLAVYRSQFGLPACTTSNGCFRKVDESGGHNYPAEDGGWAEEISLDLDMVSAICPNCHVLLVEADSASMAHLGAAEDTAVKLGADAVSNSFGGTDATDSSYGRYFHHKGVAITASAGDNGYGASYPASSKWVTAVGGTTLKQSSRASRGFTESVWSDGGSGCSTKNSASWQKESLTGCSGRAEADVAAVADPATGVAVYDSDSFQGASGWLTFGGTSASSPIIASVYALAGDTQTIDDASSLWAHHKKLNDVTSGSNGTCPTSRWCTAHSGWDGPTGFGTPNGVAAF